MASDVTVIMRTRGADGVTADVKRVGSAADDSANRVSKFGKALSNIGQIAGGITLANAAERGFGKLQDFIGSSIQAASQLEQSVGSVETVFGRASGKMLEFGEKADQSLGLSANAFNELSAVTGAFLQNYGFNADQAAAKTVDLTKRAADMAATFGGSVKDAMSAIQAALRGETDPIERYGVALNAAKIEARALAMTGKEVAASLTDQEKVAARLDLVFAQTAKTQGQFAREADTTAGKTERMQAKMENMRAELGEQLLPLQEKWIALQLQVAGFMESTIIPAIDGLTVAYGKLADAIGKVPSLPDMPGWVDKLGKAGLIAAMPGYGALKGLGALGGGGGEGSTATGIADIMGGPLATLDRMRSKFAEVGAQAEQTAGQTEKLRKGVEYLKDGIIDMGEAATLGLSAMEAGAVEAFDALLKEQERVDNKAFEHSKTLAKLATMYEKSEQAAGRLLKTLASAALDATRNAGSAIFGRPTRESAALELALAQLDLSQSGAEGRINPQIDALRRQLDGLGTGVDETTVMLERQKAQYQQQLAMIGEVTDANRENATWLQTQIQATQQAINLQGQGVEIERNAIEAKIAALEAELQSYDRQREAIERQIEQYNAQQRVMEAELQLADATLLTQAEQKAKFDELLPLMGEQSEKYRELAEKLGEDLIPEMDLMREKAAAVSEAMRIVSDEKFRESLIPAIDLAAEHSRVVALRFDELAASTERAKTAVELYQEELRRGALQDKVGAFASLLTGPFAKLLGYDTGGVVPGPLGSPQLAMVHGGETILPTHKGGGMAGGVTVNLYVSGSIVSERDITRVVRDAARQGAFRGVPGFSN